MRAMSSSASGPPNGSLEVGYMAMDPTSKNALDGPAKEESMADIYAPLGDADHAIPILKRLLQTPPYRVTPALLRLDPVWDQIRNDPRFQELAAEKKP